MSAIKYVTNPSGVFELKLTIELEVEPTEEEKKRVGYLFNRAAYILGGKAPMPKRQPGDLTKTELEIAKLILRGFDNKAIASELFITTSSVKGHVTHLLRKYGVKNRQQLIVAAAPKSPDVVMDLPMGVR